MASSSAAFHEDNLTPQTRDLHRAIVSLMEELEAIDWYQQRIEGSQDADLRDILRHNRDEEKEHAVMLLEWIRRHDDVFDAKLREYLFSQGSITAREGVIERGNGVAAPAAPSATVGSLRGAR